MDNFSRPTPGLREPTTREATTRKATTVEWLRRAALISAATSMAVVFNGCGRQKELPIAVDDKSQSLGNEPPGKVDHRQDAAAPRVATSEVRCRMPVPTECS